MAPGVAARFLPATPSWVALKDVLAAPYGADCDLAEGARKFDTVPNLISLVGVQRSIDLITNIGVASIHQHNVALANRFRAQVGLAPSNSAIVTIPWPGAAERLAKAGVRVTEWRGNLRLSFHFYNSQEDIDRALSALSDAPPPRAN